MVGMCVTTASWQSKNGLLVTLPRSQPVAGLRLQHLQLLPAVAQLWCSMVEMRLPRYSRSKLPILIKMCCVVAELCWSGPFRSRPRSIPVPDPDHPCTTPDIPWPISGWTNGRFSHRLLLSHPLRVGYGSLESCYAGMQSIPWGPLSFKSRRWDPCDRSEAEWTASHGSQWVTLASGYRLRPS